MLVGAGRVKSFTRRLVGCTLVSTQACCCGVSLNVTQMKKDVLKICVHVNFKGRLFKDTGDRIFSLCEENLPSIIFLCQRVTSKCKIFFLYEIPSFSFPQTVFPCWAEVEEKWHKRAFCMQTDKPWMTCVTQTDKSSCERFTVELCSLTMELYHWVCYWEDLCCTSQCFCFRMKSAFGNVTQEQDFIIICVGFSGYVLSFLSCLQLIVI